MPNETWTPPAAMRRPVLPEPTAAMRIARVRDLVESLERAVETITSPARLREQAQHYEDSARRLIAEVVPVAPPETVLTMIEMAGNHAVRAKVYRQLAAEKEAAHG